MYFPIVLFVGNFPLLLSERGEHRKERVIHARKGAIWTSNPYILLPCTFLIKDA